MRCHHYLKNLLIFIPLFFNGSILNPLYFKYCIFGFICFSLVSSTVYIINDYKDIEKDKKHPKKSQRPLASGRIKPHNALFLASICIVLMFTISYYFLENRGVVYLLVYLGVNLAYSFGLKNIPIIDIILLASGFIIRIFYGGEITDIAISKWLYLVVTCGSLYMGLGKRRNELKREKNTRNVLKHYNIPFLDKNMYVCLTLSIVFYALWSVDMPNHSLIWTVPLFITSLMFYSLDTEGQSDGDPVEVILSNKFLLVNVVIYAILIFFMIYMETLYECIRF